MWGCLFYLSLVQGILGLQQTQFTVFAGGKPVGDHCTSSSYWLTRHLHSVWVWSGGYSMNQQTSVTLVMVIIIKPNKFRAGSGAVWKVRKWSKWWQCILWGVHVYELYVQNLSQSNRCWWHFFIHPVLQFRPRTNEFVPLTPLTFDLWVLLQWCVGGHNPNMVYNSTRWIHQIDPKSCTCSQTVLCAFRFLSESCVPSSPRQREPRRRPSLLQTAATSIPCWDALYAS